MNSNSHFRQDDKSLQWRIVQAAIIDSGIITVFTCCAIAMVTSSLPFFQTYLSAILFGGPVLTPLIYIRVSRTLVSRATPGESFLGLRFLQDDNAGRSSWFQDLFIGIAATTLSILILLLFGPSLAVVLPNSWLLINIFCRIILVPIFYSVTLAWFLRIASSGRLKRGWKVQILPLIYSPGRLVLSRVFFAPLLLLLAGITSGGETSSHYARLLLSTRHGLVSLIEILFWSLWTRPILLYSKSTFVSVIYLLMCVLPLAVWFYAGELFREPLLFAM